MKRALHFLLFICLFKIAGMHQTQAQPPCFVDATINTFGTVCEDGNPLIDLSELLFINGTTTPGGSWQIVDASDLGFGGSAFTINNTLFYLIDPTTSPVTGPPYVYNILLQYIVTDPTQPAPCDVLVSSVATVTIFGAVETGFDLPNSWCQSYGTLYVPGYTVAGGGEWDITFINGLDPGLEPFSVSSVLSFVSNGALDLNALGGLANFGLNTVADSAIIAINYQPAQGGCSMPGTEVFVLYEDVDPAWTAPQNACIAEFPLQLNPLVTGTTGGAFSGTGVIVNNNGTPTPADDIYTFAPPAPGLYSVTYTVGFGVCAESSTYDIAVYAPLDAAFNAPLVVCESPSGTVDLSALFTANMPANGVWTVTGSNLSNFPSTLGNTLSYLIAPADVAPYIINVSYDLLANDVFPEGTPCNPADIAGQVIINSATEIGFDLPDTWCVADGTINLAQYTTSGAGVWSLLTDPETPLAGNVYEPQNGAGLVGILYTPGAGGCGLPHTEYVQITDDVDPFWLNPIVLCQADLPYQLEAATLGGIWSGPGVNPISGVFGVDPQVYVLDFGSGVVTSNQPGVPGHIYSYVEDGTIISTIGGGSPSNYFERLQVGYQSDIVLQQGTSSGIRIDRGGQLFELLYVQLDAQPLSGGFTITAYNAFDVPVGTVTVLDNAPGGSVINLPPSFYGISYVTIVNDAPSIRTRIEEIAFNDLSPIVAPGYYSITYTVGNEPCVESETHIIEVVPTRSSAIRDITVCQSPSGTVDLSAMLLSGTTAGGTFTISGSTLSTFPTIDNNTLNYQIAFADIPPYTITIQYSLNPIANVAIPGPCNPEPSVATLTITNANETGFDLPDSWCVADGAIYLPNFTEIGGGTYSLADNPLTPFNESEIALAGDVFIPYNGAGLVGITYTPISNGCGSPETDFIEILDDFDVVIQPAGPFCPGADPVALSVLVTTPAPYTSGTVVNYFPGTTVNIPAGTTILVNCGDPADVCFVPVTNVELGITINYNNGSVIPYLSDATLSLPNGATITYLVSAQQSTFTTVSSGTSGQLNSADPVAARPSGSGNICDEVPGSYRYDVFEFQVSAPGNYTFIGNFGSGDGYAYITQVPFVPGDCASGIFIAKDDNSGPGLNPQFGTGSGNAGPTLTLQPGITYQLVTTGIAQNALLNYSWVFSGPGNILTATTPQGEWSGIGIIDETAGIFDPEVAGLGNHLITYTTYNGSCINTATYTIFVGDGIAPDFVSCPANVTTNTISCSAFVNVQNPTVTDNCPGPLAIGFVATHPVYGTIASGQVNNVNVASGIYPSGLTTIAWTVTDLAGNTNTCQTEILVVDSANPVIFCQQALTVTGYTSPDLCGAQINLATPVAYDNCGLDQIGFVALHTTDANGAPIDTDPNTPGNQPETIYTNTMPALINGGSNTTDIASGIYPGGTTIVTWTVTDLSGRTATCTVTVVVIDNDPPMLINCPDDIVINTYPGLCAAVPTWVPPLAIDNCSEGVDQTLIQNLLNAHTALEEAEDLLDAATDVATEADNNLALAHQLCDGVPTVACQILIATETADSIAAHNILEVVSGIYQDALAAYNLAEDALVAAAAAATITITGTHQPGDIFELGNTTVVYTATDGAGNTSTCSFVVTVIDEELPTLTCPPNVTATSIPTQCYGYATVLLPTDLNDNCGIDQDPMNTYNWGHNASDTYPVGTTTVVWSIEDINGNVGTCSMTVTILDVEPPTITFCPENTNLPLPYSLYYDYYTVTEPGVCSANIAIAPLQAWDNCGIASIVNDFTNTNDASGVYPQGTTTVLWTVTDVWGNTSTCQTIVHVRDNQAPAITCPEAISVCTSDCTNNATGEYIDLPLPQYTDNCSIEVITNSFTNQSGVSALYPSGMIYSGSGVYPIGTTSVVYTIVDVSANTNSCAFTVTVNKCCQADAGTLSISGGQCPFEPVVASSTGYASASTAVVCSNPADVYTQLYLVVSSITGLIVDVNSTGTFAALGSGLPAGNYTMYAYNSGANNPPDVAPAVGVAVESVINSAAGCFDITAGIAFTIPDEFPAAPLFGNVLQGNANDVPTFYNVSELQITGGTQPYNYNWTVSGFVEYVVNVNADGTGVVIIVVYADNATWNLIVTDANGCTSESLNFDNISDDDPSALLDIYDFTIVSSNSNAANGSVTIYVEGGTPCGSGTSNQYQYNWSGPSNWLTAPSGPVSGGASYTLNNLPTGWYIVEVTDCSGQSTIGWYWVPKQIRGRGKLADGQSMVAYPNPFDNQTTLEFMPAETGNTSLAVYGLDGKEIASLFNGQAEAEQLYTIIFNANHLPAGMYIAKLTTASGSVQHHKLLLNK